MGNKQSKKEELGKDSNVPTRQGDDSKQLNDMLPFRHGQESTHSACKEMVERLGDKVGCCTCNGHNCIVIATQGDDSLKDQIEMMKFTCPDCKMPHNLSSRDIDRIIALFQAERTKAKEEMVTDLLNDMTFDKKCADCECNEMNINLFKQSLRRGEKEK